MELTSTHAIELLLGGIVAILSWIFRKKAAEYDKHLADCNARHVEQGQMETRLESVESEIKHGKRQINWIGDCVIRIGSKMDVDLPDRP